MASSRDQDVEQKRILLNEVLEREGDQLQRVIRGDLRRFRLAFSGDEAEELARDIFVETAARAHQIAERYYPDRAAYPWLRAIAFQVLRERARKLKRDRQITVIPVAEVPQVQAVLRQLDLAHPSEAEMFDVLYEPERDSSCRRTRLMELLHLVSEGDRQLLVWHFLEGVDDGSQAARLGIGRGNVRVRRHRALRRLLAAAVDSERREGEEG